MSFKTLITIVFIILMFSGGCSMFEQIIYHPIINQGNYLNSSDINKVQIGMNKQQIIDILGNSIITYSFNPNIWCYIFRREFSHKRFIQQTLILTFNDNGILVQIDHKKH